MLNAGENIAYGGALDVANLIGELKVVGLYMKDAG